MSRRGSHCFPAFLQGPGPFFSFAATSAPCCSSSFTAESRPSSAAKCSGVKPRRCAAEPQQFVSQAGRAQGVQTETTPSHSSNGNDAQHARISALLYKRLDMLNQQPRNSQQLVLQLTSPLNISAALAQLGCLQGTPPKPPETHWIRRASHSSPWGPGPSHCVPLVSAPCFSSSSTMELWPAYAAQCRAVWPRRSEEATECREPGGSCTKGGAVLKLQSSTRHGLHETVP